jgi:hypothetical protein
MAKVEIKSKEAKMKAAMSGGKAKRKKWSKGKVREKIANLVQFDQKTFDRMQNEVPKVRFFRLGMLSTMRTPEAGAWGEVLQGYPRNSHLRGSPLPCPSPISSRTRR